MVRGAILLTTINAKWIHPSLALRLLKANLGDLEGDCEILEFALRQPVAEKLAAIQDRRPGILGISVSIWNHGVTLELLEALEREWAAPVAPGASSPAGPVVVLGGPEVSYLPEDAEIFRHADYVIRGEGEDAFRELCGVLLGRGEPAAGDQRDDGRNDGQTNKRNDEQRGRPPVRFINGSPADLARIRQAYHYYG
ncbi:MAG: cobalamin B12-binding domain-containing protein, partial [Treponema sp.]|nr:cobalamin B12-binding domain-containing protein [Treponema sp.]